MKGSSKPTLYYFLIPPLRTLRLCLPLVGEPRGSIKRCQSAANGLREIKTERFFYKMIDILLDLLYKSAMNESKAWKVLCLIISLCSLLSVSVVSAQEGAKQDFFAATFGEAVGYGYNEIAYGGGLIIGGGTGGALGLRILYAQDNENISFLEVNVLARLYVFGRDAFSGPFVQLSAGPVIYADKNPDRSGYGNISAGLSAGWRFLLGKNFFVEPALRIGYPYLIGGGLSAGARWGL